MTEHWAPMFLCHWHIYDVEACIKYGTLYRDSTIVCSGLNE